MNNNKEINYHKHCTYSNYNTWKQSMAGREQLTLHLTQVSEHLVNEHKWKRNVKKLGLFKINVYASK